MKYEISTIDIYYQNILYSLASAVNAKNILETGIRDGLSTKTFIRYLEKQGKLISVDIQKPSFDNLDVNHNIIVSDAIEFLANCNEKFDLIFLDDWHSKEHVLKEIELCEKLLHERSIILIHDTMSYCSDPFYNIKNEDGEFADGGPYAALQELDKNKWEFCTIPYSHGITILRKIQ